MSGIVREVANPLTLASAPVTERALETQAGPSVESFGVVADASPLSSSRETAAAGSSKDAAIKVGHVPASAAIPEIAKFDRQSASASSGISEMPFVKSPGACGQFRGIADGVGPAPSSVASTFELASMKDFYGIPLASSSETSKTAEQGATAANSKVASLKHAKGSSLSTLTETANSPRRGATGGACVSNLPSAEGPNTSGHSSRTAAVAGQGGTRSRSTSPHTPPRGSPRSKRAGGLRSAGQTRFSDDEVAAGIGNKEALTQKRLLKQITQLDEEWAQLMRDDEVLQEEEYEIFWAKRTYRYNEVLAAMIGAYTSEWRSREEAASQSAEWKGQICSLRDECDKWRAEATRLWKQLESLQAEEAATGRDGDHGVKLTGRREGGGGHPSHNSGRRQHL